MAPPSLGFVASGETNKNGDDDGKYSKNDHGANIASVLQGFSGIRAEQLKLPSLDLSANTSLLDLSEVAVDDEWLLSTSMAGPSSTKVSLGVEDGKEWFKRNPSHDTIGTCEKKFLVNILDSMAELSLIHI